VRNPSVKTVRIATWNTKQGVAPRQKAPVLWEWITRAAEPDVVVLTEARITKEGVPEGWQAIYTPGGLGKRRNYGTIIAARGIELRRTDFRRTQPDVNYPHPATTFAVEVVAQGKLQLVVLGAYGMLSDEGNGYEELERIIEEYSDLVAEYGRNRIVVAGDFNLWPSDVLPVMLELGLVDVTSQRDEFPKLRAPRGDSRIWTHKNGAKDTDGARQELDFIFVSSDLREGLSRIKGGVDDFPDVWDMSDHAPVAVSLSF